MSRNPRFDAILKRIKDTHDKKNEDYADNDNPYSNFEGAANVAGVSVDDVFRVMIGIKAERLRQLGTGKTPNFESEDDSILDLAVYAILWLSYRQPEPEPERPVFENSGNEAHTGVQLRR